MLIKKKISHICLGSRNIQQVKLYICTLAYIIFFYMYVHILHLKEILQVYCSLGKLFSLSYLYWHQYKKVIITKRYWVEMLNVYACHKYWTDIWQQRPIVVVIIVYIIIVITVAVISYKNVFQQLSSTQ